MTKNEALVVARIAENMRTIKRLAGMLRQETEAEMVDALQRYHIPVSFHDFKLMESVVIGVAERHGHMDIRSIVDDAQALVGA